MSNENNNGGVPFQVYQPKVAHLPCQVCANVMNVEEPPIRVLNSLTDSVIVIPHTDAIVCGGCGSVYTLAVEVQQARILTSLVVVRKAEPKIIVPN